MPPREETRDLRMIAVPDSNRGENEEQSKSKFQFIDPIKMDDQIIFRVGNRKRWLLPAFIILNLTSCGKRFLHLFIFCRSPNCFLWVILFSEKCMSLFFLFRSYVFFLFVHIIQWP